MDPLSDEQIIDRLGGAVKIARMCDITPQAVSMWRKKGMPRLRRQLLLLLNPQIAAEPQDAPAEAQPEKATA